MNRQRFLNVGLPETGQLGNLTFTPKEFGEWLVHQEGQLKDTLKTDAEATVYVRFLKKFGYC